MRMVQLIERRIDPLIRLPTAGLDISDVSVKYLAFDPKTRRGAHRMLTYGEFAVPEGMIVKGEIKKEDDLARVFSAWRIAEKRMAHSTFFTVSLPEEKSFLRVIQLPRLEGENLQRAIRWEIEANIPMAFEDMAYDYEVIERPAAASRQDHLDVVLTAFPKALIEAYVRVLRAANLSFAALELESQAIARAAVPDLSDHAARVIADIGRTRTSFIVCVGGAIIFTTTIELGGQLFEEHLAKTLHVSQEDARAIKMRIGLDRTERNGAVFDALLPITAVLADELARVVEYYSRHAEHVHGAPDAIGSVMLVGGDANLSGLTTYLSSALRLPVSLADPFVGIMPKGKFALPPLPKNEALALATTIGLALRGIRNA